MRQSQQKNRMRGRGGRKGPNPMSRTYESNGPDVKIRGTAAHVAEKYSSLARDALAMGDNVMAENYLQHAEHYNRIIMAATAQQATRGEENAGYGRGPQPDIGGQDQDDEDGGDDRFGNDRFASVRPQRPQHVEQSGGQSSGQPSRQSSGHSAGPSIGQASDQPSGQASGQAEDDDDQPAQAEASEKRPRGEGRHRRRPRRERDDASREEGGEAASANGVNGAHAANGNGSEKAKRDISSDASMLPESILGAGPAAREAAAED